MMSRFSILQLFNPSILQKVGTKLRIFNEQILFFGKK